MNYPGRLRPWLEYMDGKTGAEVKRMECDEQGCFLTVHRRRSDPSRKQGFPFDIQFHSTSRVPPSPLPGRTPLPLHLVHEMGNLCGKEGPVSPAPTGHVLGSAPVAARQKAKNPKKPKVTGPGRTLGASDSGPGHDGKPQSTPVDARAAAALAAEVWGRPITRVQVNGWLMMMYVFPIATIKQRSEKWQVGGSVGSRQTENTEPAHPGFGKDQGTTGGIGLGLELFVLLLVQCA